MATIIDKSIRRIARRIQILAIIPLVAGRIAFGQIDRDPASSDSVGTTQPSANLVSIGLDKNLSTYLWNGRFIFRESFGPLSLWINENYNSAVIESPTKTIRDDHRFDARAVRRIFDGVSATLRVNSFILSDDQKTTDGARPSLNRASSHSFYGGAEAEVLNGVFIEPLLGIRYDNQIGISDRGPSILFGAWSPGLGFGGYATRFDARFQQDMLEPRTLERHGVFLGIGKTFAEGSRDSLQLNYSLNQRDFYFAADTTTTNLFGISHNIERRIESVLSASNLLEYAVDERLSFALQGSLVSRTIDQNYRYRPVLEDLAKTLLNGEVIEFRIMGSLRMSYRMQNELLASLQVLISERDERHAVEPDDRVVLASDIRRRDESKKDNLSRRTAISSFVDMALSRSDRIVITGSSTLLRYDTPSIENADDRDELWYSVRAMSFHQINPHLHLTLTGDVNMSHLVYLFKERSANNSWNRVFRLAPRLFYSPWDWISTSNTFEVLANYTVYDFENTPAVQVQSYSFRQFSIQDSTRISVSTRLTLLGFANIRFYQRGELRWDVFKERPLNYFEEKTIIGSLQYLADPGLIFSIGLRYFTQHRYGYPNGIKTFESLLTSFGPAGSIEWEMAGRSALAIEGWREKQSQTGSQPHRFVNMTVSISYRL